LQKGWGYFCRKATMWVHEWGFLSLILVGSSAIAIAFSFVAIHSNLGLQGIWSEIASKHAWVGSSSISGFSESLKGFVNLNEVLPLFSSRGND